MKKNLVSVEWLKTHLNNPDLIVLDATLPKVSEKDKPLSTIGIVGAKKMDLEKVFVNPNSGLPNTVPSKDVFEENIKKLGVSNSSTVIVYDQHGIYSAPRAWWLLKLFGHEKVFVLNGGLPEWMALNLPELISPLDTTETHGNFKANLNRHLLTTKDEVVKNCSTKQSIVVDARSPKRFYAEVEEPRVGMRSGHIPGSKNLHYANVLTENGCLLEAKNLHEKFKDVTTHKKQSLIYTCGSGITACIIALAGSQIGFDHFSVYDGSWSEWGADKYLPVA